MNATRYAKARFEGNDYFLRIVSLFPAATEIVCALGLADDLVGISHECNYPPALIAGKSVVTSTRLATIVDADGEEEAEALSVGEIDALVRETLATGESLFQIDVERIRSLQPDLVITQGLCDICAMNYTAVNAAVDALGDDVAVIDLMPTTLEGVLESFILVGASTGRLEQANELAAHTRERWERVRERAATLAERPKTLLLEWPDPPFSAGHWNPELLTLAGGIAAPWDIAGERSRTLSWEEIVAFAPEMIVMMACGFDAYRALDEAWAMTDAPGWYDIPAVRDGECYTVDGSAYFNRPGPRLAESAEILATILHPEHFTEMLPPYSVQRFYDDLLTPQTEDVAPGDAE